MGSGKYFWHIGGVWCPSYEDCDAILRSQQQRTAAFGCVEACVPDLFATNILIFLSNDGSPDSEWAAIKQAVHKAFPLSQTNKDYKDRLEKLNSYLQEEWATPSLKDFSNTDFVEKMVCKSVFWMMFGVWIKDEEAKTLTGWRTNAPFFILPRLMQRFLFNTGINKVKKLREDTIKIIEDNSLQYVFTKMNESLPVRYRREETVKLADEIMYVIGFAGMGGTSACVESVGAFLQNKKPKGSYDINFGTYKTPAEMVAAYTKDPYQYIREVCRLDPPVTSATQVLKEASNAEINGRDYSLPAGTLNQYVLSIGNRDEQIFPEPSTFDPTRANVTKALTWNGAFGEQGDDKAYPRLCPGRYMALDVCKALVTWALHNEEGGPQVTMPKESSACCSGAH